MSDNLHRYKVIIPYREPTYEIHRGKRPDEPYSAEYFITASSPEEAEKEAITQFHKEAENTSVSLMREPDYSGIKIEMVQE